MRVVEKKRDKRVFYVGAPSKEKAIRVIGVRAIKISRRVIRAARDIVHVYFQIPTLIQFHFTDEQFFSTSIKFSIFDMQIIGNYFKFDFDWCKCFDVCTGSLANQNSRIENSFTAHQIKQLFLNAKYF